MNKLTEVPFNCCIVIPVYNHEHGLSIILPKIQQQGWPIILVNDGSNNHCKQALDNMVATHASVQLVNLPYNQGKGAALKAGMKAAAQQSFTHAVQIDADGQHNIEDIEAFITLGKKYPNAIICGHPIYDGSVPKHRFYARYLTHIWIWINCLSFNVKDSMCGFRCYPVIPFMSIVDTEYTGNRMDFDSEIMVRWVWRNHQVINHATHVSYPLDGLSHFLLWKDNYLITKMHTRLFFGMLRRLPKLIARKFTKLSF
jgi:glycosyltransferase involved in cell wall biosynthesis